MNRFLSSLNPKYMYTSRSYFSLNLITNLIACLCVIMLSSCNKDPYQDGTPELPPITMEGKNTLGFLLDGEVWVPYQENPGIFTPTLETILDGNSLRISARLKKPNETFSQNLNIAVNIQNEGKYHISPPPASGIVYINSNLPEFGCNHFKCTPLDTEVNILHSDRGNRIVSGTFYFKNAANSCNDTLQITEGRFDLKY